MFMLIEHYPMAQFLSLIAIIGILGYFVTSSDSASFVIDMITSNGMTESPKIQRVFWALSEGAAATALLAAGGEDALMALQTASIAAAFPFIFLLIIMVYSLIRAFQMDEELLMRGKERGNGHQLHYLSGHHQGDAMRGHEAVTSTDSIMNGNSTHSPNDKVIPMMGSDAGDDHGNALRSKGDEIGKKWRIGFFDDL